MRKLIIAGGVVVVLAAAAVLALPALVGTDTIRGAVTSAFKDRTGRTLSIDGDIGLSIVPRIHITANKVSLSNPPGYEADFAAIERLEINLDPMPALTGKLVVQSIELTRPRINLAVNEQGAGNWTFDAGGANGSADGGSGELSVPDALTIRLTDGLATFNNAQTGASHTFSDVNLEVSSERAAGGPVAASGDMLWNGEKMTVAASLTTPARLNRGEPARIVAEIAAGGVQVDLSGDLRKQDAGRLELSDIRLAAAGTTATGTIAFAPGEARPMLSAEMKLDTLDLGAIAGVEEQDSDAAKGWSTEKIDLQPLGALDGDIRLVVSEIRYGRIRTGAAVLHAKLRDGVLTADVPNLELYEGTTDFALAVDSSKADPTVSLKGKVNAVDALAFLRDAADIEKIEGRADLTFDLTSAGASMRDIMAALKGPADLDINNGALLGVDVGRILRAVHRGQTGGFPEGGKTPFGNLIAEFRFDKGIGFNRKLRMSGGEVVITGGGKVTMPDQTLAYRINPVLVGKGGITVLGINVPIIISGPWANPSVYPDLPGILDAPEMALKGLKSVGEGGVTGVTGVTGAAGAIKKTLPVGPGSKSNPVGKLLKSPFK